MSASPSNAAAAIPAVRCRALVKRYGSVVAVDGLDLDVHLGECFGMLGPNGAGKTTTIEILEGLSAPDAGEVLVLGERWQGDGLALKARLGIQLQETKYPEKLKVGETLALFRSFYPRGLSVDEALAIVALQEKAGAYVRNLSGGQRQRLSLACALVGDPELVFLDEPTTGLDPQSRRQAWEIVEDLKRRGRTILLTTHYMEEAARLCDRVAIVDRGKVIALGSPRELIASLGAEHVVEFAVGLADGGLGAEPRPYGGVSPHGTGDGLRPAPEPDWTPEDGALAALPSVLGVARENGAWRLSVREVHRAVPALLAALAEHGREPSQLSVHSATLEDVFVHLTGRTLRDA